MFSQSNLWESADDTKLLTLSNYKECTSYLAVGNPLIYSIILSFYNFIILSIKQSIYLSIYWLIYPSIYLCIYLLTCLDSRLDMTFLLQDFLIGDLSSAPSAAFQILVSDVSVCSVFRSSLQCPGKRSQQILTQAPQRISSYVHIYVYN